MSDRWAMLNDCPTHLRLASRILHQRNQRFSAISGSALVAVHRTALAWSLPAPASHPRVGADCVYPPNNAAPPRPRRPQRLRLDQRPGQRDQSKPTV